MFDLISENISSIIPIAIIIVTSFVTIFKQIRSKKKAVDVIRTLVDSTDRILAELGEDKAHAIKHDLKVAHEMKGVSEIVDREISTVREKRRSNNNLELGVDIDEDFNYKAGAKWKINF